MARETFPHKVNDFPASKTSTSRGMSPTRKTSSMEKWFTTLDKCFNPPPRNLVIYFYRENLVQF